MPVKSGANDWSGQMQMGGQVCVITHPVQKTEGIGIIPLSSGGRKVVPRACYHLKERETSFGGLSNGSRS